MKTDLKQVKKILLVDDSFLKLKNICLLIIKVKANKYYNKLVYYSFFYIDSKLFLFQNLIFITILLII